MTHSDQTDSELVLLLARMIIVIVSVGIYAIDRDLFHFEQGLSATIALVAPLSAAAVKG